MADIPPPAIVVDLQPQYEPSCPSVSAIERFISDFEYPNFSDISPPETGFEQLLISTADATPPEPYNPDDWFPVSPTASVPMTLEDLDRLDDILNLVENE